jgi:two-component system, cell cycle sensor histidine kinase and response regulator CckA
VGSAYQNGHRTHAALAQSLFEHALDAVLVTAPDGAVLDANPAACAMFRGRLEEICAVGRDGLVDTSDPRLAPMLAERTATGATRGRLTMRRLDGHPFEVELSSRQFTTSAGDLRTAMVVRELTEQHRLEGVEHSYRDLFMSAYDAIAVFDLTGEIVDINEAGAALLEYDRAAIIGTHFETYAPPEVIEQLRTLHAGRVAGDNAGRRYESALLTAAGARIPVEITSAALSEGGRIVGFTCVIRDLRERRRAEELEMQIRHDDKLKSLGVLAGGVAHDFNNLLTVIRSSADLVRQAETPEALGRSLDVIAEAVQRGTDLTGQLLLFSRRQPAELRRSDLNTVVTGARQMLERLIGPTVEIDEQLHGEPLPVRADLSQLQQSLVNLAINARDAMPDGGTIHVRTQKDGGRASLLVEDTGVGMEPAVADRIFEPFFTTKEAGKGTGLGLATVYAIVQSIGGTIDVTSVPGVGTTFRISLPLAD